MPSSTMMRAARRIFGSSPSGNTIRFGSLDGAVDDAAHDPARPSQPRLELVAVILDVDELLRDTAGHGRPCHGRRDPEQHARIEGEGNQVVRPELHGSEAVQRGHALRARPRFASAASARVAAIFISSFTSVARASSAPRKMNGKPRTLLTWFG